MKRIIFLLITLLFLLSACADLNDIKKEDNTNDNISIIMEDVDKLLKDNKSIPLIILIGLLAGGNGQDIGDGCNFEDIWNGDGFGNNFNDGFGYGCSLFKNEPK